MPNPTTTPNSAEAPAEPAALAPLPEPLRDGELAAWHALSASAAVFTSDDAQYLQFDGPKAGDVITGLVTNDVLALVKGTGQYAAALTAKGKIIADLYILRTGAELFVTRADAGAFAGWRDLVRKYVNPRLAKYHVLDDVRTIAVHGLRSTEVLESAIKRMLTSTSDVAPGTPTGFAQVSEVDRDLPTTPYAHRTFGSVRVVRSPVLGAIPGYDVFGPAEDIDALQSVLLAEPGVARANHAVWEVARIAAGRPKWGSDMNDTTIPQEANLGDVEALSFSKGCYTGQETVARVHFRGHVNRHLRLLESREPLRVGSEITTGDGKVVGDVRSSAIVPDRGPVALAMIRREVPVGSIVSVAGTDAMVQSTGS